MTQKPPQLKDVSQCSVALDFAPYSPWPQGLPAVAVNGVLLAGFQQSIVFDHHIPEDSAEAIASMFRSLYFELTSVELARLFEVSRHIPWLPIDLIFGKFQLRWNESTKILAQLVARLPSGFQKFCADRKWSFSEFSPLLSADRLKLEPLYLQIVDRQLSRAVAVQVLEIFIELMLLDHSIDKLLASDAEDSDRWVKRLRSLRYPESSQADDLAAQKIKSLPWPGTSSARWTRQGDRAGIELKLFVSNPTDLKKYLNSLAAVQEALEREGPWNKH